MRKYDKKTWRSKSCTSPQGKRIQYLPILSTKTGRKYRATPLNTTMRPTGSKRWIALSEIFKQPKTRYPLSNGNTKNNEDQSAI